jgi:hypothetical protein
MDFCNAPETFLTTQHESLFRADKGSIPRCRRDRDTLGRGLDILETDAAVDAAGRERAGLQGCYASRERWAIGWSVGLAAG